MKNSLLFIRYTLCLLLVFFACKKRISKSGATPMYAKRVVQELPEDFLRFYVVGAAFTPLNTLVYYLKNEIDIVAGYNPFQTNVTRNSSNLSETMFHELTHAAHYNKVGNGWWNDFVDAELNNIIWHSGQNPPYGLGDQGATSALIALGESWAYHVGHFITDWKYGVNSGCTSEQADINGVILTQFCPNGTNRPQIEVLEEYNPNLNADPDRWIPKGLFLDLIDVANETRPPASVNDVVSGYTNQQFFSALQSDVRTMQQHRDRLLQQTGFNQGVLDIFREYNIH